MIRSILSSDPDYHHCLNPNCTAGQLHPQGAGEPIFTCDACGHRHCIVCKGNWHEGRPCPSSEAAQISLPSESQAHIDTDLTRIALEDAEAGVTWAQYMATQEDAIRQYEQQAGEAAEEKRRREEAEKAAAQRRQEEEASAAIIKDTAKECPKCRSNIEKNRGCDHMTCKTFQRTYDSCLIMLAGRACKHEFCWLCLAAYPPIRRHGCHMYATGCRWFTRLPTTSRW